MGRIDSTADLPEERPERGSQGELDGVVVHLLTGGKLPFHHEHVAIIGTHVLVEDHPVEGEHHVVRGERLAVGPLEALAEVEGDGEAVLGDLPGLGQGRLHLIGDGVHLGEAGVKPRSDVRGARLLGDVVVKGLGVIPSAHHKVPPVLPHRQVSPVALSKRNHLVFLGQSAKANQRQHP